jgi:uncharacterized protein
VIKINTFEKFNMKGSTFLEGFPGVGLVGPMAISYVVDKLKMTYVGYIDSDDFPPLVSIHATKPMPPIRIYFSEKSKVSCVFAEFPIPVNLIHELTNAVYAFAKDNGASNIVSIGGLPVQNVDGKTVFVVASNEKALAEATKIGLKPIAEGVSAGVSALLLLKASMDKFPATNILIPINQQGIINPGYAELAIVTLNKLINLKIDVEALEKEARAVEAKIKELMKKSQETHEGYKKATDGAPAVSGPSMYA